MRRLFRKIQNLAVNIFFLIGTFSAVGTILVPKADLSFKIFWAWAATTCVFVFVIWLVRKRKPIKGGHLDKQGYVLVTGTTIYQHRQIAKAFLNRNLHPNEVVHHINGKRSDNRLVNLCVMDRHEHELFHAWLDWKKKKSGKYPSIEDQKRLLQDKHNGILLETRAHFRFNTKSSPARLNFTHREAKKDKRSHQEDYSRKIFSELREERRRLAHQHRIPAYLVFKDFTLVEMAKRLPEDSVAMEDIIGVTPEKLRLYGENFLAIIRRYRTDMSQLNKRNSVS